MTLVGWVMIVFWVGLLMFGMVIWALNKTFVQLQDIEKIELDEIDGDNIKKIEIWINKRESSDLPKVNDDLPKVNDDLPKVNEGVKK